MYRVGSMIINSVKRGLAISNNVTSSGFSTFTSPLCIQMTQILMASPMKKKKKLDPNILKVREERKRKRLWREIKRLTRLQKQLKPIDEIEIPYSLVDEPAKYERRKPVLSSETLDERSDLLRKWCAYKTRLHSQDLQMIDRLETTRSRALAELLIASPELYQEAVKFDETLLPFVVQGTTATPPIKDYNYPDGDYVDVTKKWDPPKIPDLDKRTKAIKLQRMNEQEKK